MRCRICGAKLKKDGDICSNCYKLYQEEEDLKKDTSERLVIKRKYSISYNLLSYFWIFLIAILSAIVCVSGGDFLYALLILFVCAVILGGLLFIDKRISLGTKAIFYDRKVVYKFNFLFIDNEKVVKYSDLRDVKIFSQSFLQRKFGYGDICFYAKGTIPGVSLLNGFQIKNVENVEEVLQKIGNIIGTIEK